MLRSAAEDFAIEAVGRTHRDDAVLGRSGGPAGNARLTAWTGLILLVLFLAELVTLLDLHGLLSWHVAIGALLIPPALLKTATTGWRIVRYYAGNRPYRVAGPPPMLLRLLGPIVVVSTLAVLGTGLTLILVNPSSGRQPLIALGGYGVSVLFLHKATFVIWGAATGVHTLGRLVPALRLTVAPAVARRVPGGFGRGATITATIALAAAVAVLALSLIGPWRADRPDGPYVHDKQVVFHEHR
jgi:hypothetical protein